MLVITRAPFATATGSSRSKRARSNGSWPWSGSSSLRCCPRAMVRSAKHSSTRSSTPARASCTAGSTRSPAKPAPLPIRTHNTPVSRATAVITRVVPKAQPKMNRWWSPRSTLDMPSRMNVEAVSGLSGKPVVI